MFIGLYEPHIGGTTDTGTGGSTIVALATKWP